MLFAEINPTTYIVLRVIVCDSKQWCIDNLGGMWVETFDSLEGKNYAGVGYTYHPTKENFSSPQPDPLSVLNDECKWETPEQYEHSEAV